MRTRGHFSQTLDTILLVRVEITLEPVPVSRILLGSFPGKDVRRNPIEEPAVVTCDDCTARECKQRFLKARERLGIEIVCWLIEQEEITSLLECEREVKAVALSTREHTCRLALVLALETEARHVCATRHFGLAHLNDIEAVRNNFPQ